MCCAGGRGMSDVLVTIERMIETCALSATGERLAGSPAGPAPAPGSPADAGLGWPLDPDAPLVSLERLEERIRELDGHQAAGTRPLLQLVARFDAPLCRAL